MTEIHFREGTEPKVGRDLGIDKVCPVQETTGISSRTPHRARGGSQSKCAMEAYMVVCVHTECKARGKIYYMYLPNLGILLPPHCDCRSENVFSKDAKFIKKYSLPNSTLYIRNSEGWQDGVES